MAKARTVKQRSSQIQDNGFFLSLLCLHTIADQHICSGFGLKDPLLVLFPVSLGTRVRVRIQMLCSRNDVHPFYLGA